MATMKVLLKGGRAAGLIKEVDEHAASVTVMVPGLRPEGPDIVTDFCAPVRDEPQVYVPGDGEVASGYPVWVIQ